MKKIIIGALLASLSVGCSEPPEPVAENYQKPYKYYGRSVEDIYSIFKVRPNEAGYIRYDNELINIMFQATSGKVEYIEVQLKETAPCRSDKFLTGEKHTFERLGMGNNILKLDPDSIHNGVSVYYDNTSRFEVSARCYQNGEPVTLSFSREYYRKI